MVLATQNPLEQEGTFHLPEAQLDRFLLKTIVSYPTHLEEKEILQKSVERETLKIKKVFSKKDIIEYKKLVNDATVSESAYEYICRITFATRNSVKYPEITYGGSPRASLALLRTAKVLAVMDGRDYVIPEDIKEMALPVLRHRIILSYEALADGVEIDSLIRKILDDVNII